MSHKRKLYTKNSVFILTSRVEENLPFAMNVLINTALWGIMARAKYLHDVSICHFIFMSNHFHILAVANNEEDIPKFVKQIKQESAAMINRLCGVRQKTVWTDGFDDPVILSADKVIDFIEYIYCNPANAHLVKSIEQYPGVSSWEMFKNNIQEKECVWLKRVSFFKLNHKLHNLAEREQRGLIDSMSSVDDVKIFHTFRLEPNAWMNCFPEYEGVDVEEVNASIINSIKTKERQILHGKDVVGVSRLKTQRINKTFRSEKFGKRMICICSNVKQRIAYISWFKEVSAQAREAYKKIEQGIKGIAFPAGMFLPGGRLLEPLPKELLFEFW